MPLALGLGLPLAALCNLVNMVALFAFCLSITLRFCEVLMLLRISE
jgi:hypothetical protein